MKTRLLIAALAIYFLAGAALVLLLGHFRGAMAYGPVQPIAFSHALHIEHVGLACDHCHAYAERARHPGIPPLETCMECHVSVATERPEIQTLTGYWEREKPIAWSRVHELPGHVYFTHKRHLRAGVTCAECHGELRAQERVRQVRSLKMGWCLRCHRSRAADQDCWICHQ